MRSRAVPTLLAASLATVVYARYGRPAPHSMVWGTPGESTWTWLLDPGADGTTRLISRVRSRYNWRSPSILMSGLIEFTDIWMMRKMMMNLRGRAEWRWEQTRATQGAGLPA